MTLDLHWLFRVLIETYGENIVVEFELMSSTEQGHTSKLVKVSGVDDGLLEVTERFWILEGKEKEMESRRKDLEEKVVKYGQK